MKLRFIALEPLSHNSDEREGNKSFFRSIKILDNGMPAEVPVVTGNSLRGRLRRIAARRILQDVGAAAAALPPALYHLFFDGGSIAKGETKTNLPVSQINALRAELPILGLFGGTYAGTILPSTLRPGFIWPVCRETQSLTGVASDIDAHQLLTDIFFTRRDDGGTDQEESVQMIYEFEALVAGCALITSLSTERATPLETSFLGAVVSEYLRHPALGGGQGRGMGRVAVEIVEGAVPDPATYERHVDERREFMRDALRGMGATL